MNRKELIDAMAAKTDCTKACADRSIGALIDIVTATLKKGDDDLCSLAGRVVPKEILGIAF